MPHFQIYQWKVIGGYSLLFLLSILAAVLIYKQIIKLIVKRKENSDNPNETIHYWQYVTGLYDGRAGNAFVRTGSGISPKVPGFNKRS